MRNFPIHKLILLHYKDDTKPVEEFSGGLRSTLGIPVSLRLIEQPDIIRSAMEHVSQIIKDEGPNLFWYGIESCLTPTKV